MTVTTSSPVAGVIRTTQLDQSTKLSAALKTSAPSISSGDSSNDNDSSAVETSSLTQSPTVSFRIDALNIAFAGTKVDVIDSGAAQVSRLLGQLQSLATRASAGGLSKSALAQLDGQFQALRIAINNVPPGPPNDEIPVSSLTDGLPVTSNPNAVVGGFNDQKLLGDANLLTPEAATAATATIAQASTQIDAQRVTLADVQNQLDFASASADSAIQNQDALRSTLSTQDLTASPAAATSLAASLLANPDAAITAQTSKLPANILQLLQQ